MNKLYSLRTRSNNETIMTFKERFYDLIKNKDGWVIRLFIQKIRKDIEQLRGKCLINGESTNRIEDIISENGDYFFHDSLNYFSSVCFIDGLMNSNLPLTQEELLDMICLMFHKLKENN